MFPALWAPPRSRWSSWLGMSIVFPPPLMATSAQAPDRHCAMALGLPQRVRLAAPSHIHIRYREHPALPTVCLPITHCRTSCASHDVGKCVVRRQVVGLLRCPGQIMGMGLAAADQPGCGALAFAFGPRIRGLGI